MKNEVKIKLNKYIIRVENISVRLDKEKVVRRMNKLGMRKSQLARATGRTDSYVGDLLHGRKGTCSFDMADRINKALERD